MNYYKLRLFAFGAILINLLIINCYASHSLKQELDSYTSVVLTKRSDIDLLLTDDHNNHFSNIQLNQYKDITRTDCDLLFKYQLPYITKLTMNGSNNDMLGSLIKHLSRDNNLQELSIFNSNSKSQDVDQKIIRQLFEVVASKPILKALNFSDNSFEDVSAMGLIKFLNKSQNLTSLTVKNSNLSDFEAFVGIETFISALSKSQKLTFVHLSENKLCEKLQQGLAQLIEKNKNTNTKLNVKYDLSFGQSVKQKQYNQKQKEDNQNLIKRLEQEKGISLRNDPISLKTAQSEERKIYKRIHLDFGITSDGVNELDDENFKSILNYVSSNAESLLISSGTMYNQSHSNRIIEDITQIITKSQKLKVLKFAKEIKKVEDMQKVVSALQSKNTLLKLSLNSHVKDEVLKILLEGCGSLDCLQELGLEKQSLTIETIPTLVKFITNNKSLTSLALCEPAFISFKSNQNDNPDQKLFESFIGAFKNNRDLTELVFRKTSDGNQSYVDNFIPALKDLCETKKAQNINFKITGINLE